jgi:tetratricopeptide (TPR) repeat protein
LRLLALKAACLVWCLASAQAQNPANPNNTVVVMPFENTSGAPGLEWISEAFPEILTQRLSSPNVFVLTRDDRLRAYDRAGIPGDIHPTRATMYRLMEPLDVDYVVFGRYTFDGRRVTATAQILDMQQKKLSAGSQESGPLVDLINTQTALAWDLLHTLRPNLIANKEAFTASAAPIRLDAFENYIRGILAETTADKIHHLREATRLNPGYNDAWLQLGKTYFGSREFDQAISSLSQVTQTDPASREANFYLGLGAYYLGDFSKAQDAFAFVSARLPLTEVDNNLGVVTARLGNKKSAATQFQKAVQEDPNDADYHFNLGVALYESGDLEGALREMNECVALRPDDSEATSFLEAISGAKSRPIAQSKVPLERIKRNYDESSFRQLMLGIQAAAEERLAKTDAATHAEFYVGRGQELLAKGFVVEAEEEFRQGLALAPGNAEAHAGLARTLEARDDLSGARAEAEAALSIRIFIDPLLILARLDLRDNKADAAAQSVDRALTLDPANTSALTLKRAVAAKLAEKAQPLPN